MAFTLYPCSLVPVEGLDLPIYCNGKIDCHVSVNTGKYIQHGERLRPIKQHYLYLTA